MVEAFLIDRSANRDCFTRAHALGRRANRQFGWRVPFNSDIDGYLNKCGTLALHSRFGLSPGGTTTGRCSICGAADFGCDHISGRSYDGIRCHRVITRWNVDEVSIVRRPRDPRCYKIFSAQSLEDAEEDLGIAIAEGASIPCRHCMNCPGQLGPSSADLDPSSWPEVPGE